MLRRLFSLSERLGLTLTIVGIVLWHYALFRSGPQLGTVLVSQPGWVIYPALGVFFYLATAGALVSLWLIGDHTRFRSRGFRIRWIKNNSWFYEERVRSGKPRLLPFERVFTGNGYPAPCVVYISSEGDWNSTTLPWAWNRRAEILGRINICSGGAVTAFEPNRD